MATELPMAPAQPARDRRVVLTRPAPRQQALIAQLQRAGCEVLSLPALTITPIPPNASHVTERCAATDSNLIGPLTGQSEVAPWAPSRFDALVFVSRGAWQSYWRSYLQGCWPDSQTTATTRTAANTTGHAPIIACVGRATAKQIAHDLDWPLSAVTYPTEAMGLSSDSEGLWTLLQPKLGHSQTSSGQVNGQTGCDRNQSAATRVLIVRGQVGRDWLADTLSAHGAAVTCLSVYRREMAMWTPAQRQTLEHWAASHQNTGVWLITSAEGLDAIARQFDQHGLTGKPGLQPQAVLVIHDRLVTPVRHWLHHWAGADRTRARPDIAVRVVAPEDADIAKSVLGDEFGSAG